MNLVYFITEYTTSTFLYNLMKTTSTIFAKG